MKKTAAFTTLLLCVAPVAIWASIAPPHKTLAERVDLATHVVVGTAKKVKVVHGVENEKQEVELREVKPEPETIVPSKGQYIEIEIEVEEVIYPLTWKAPKTVKYMFGGGWFGVKDVRQSTLNKKHLYLMQSNPYPELKKDESLFFPSYSWNLCDSVDEKADVIALLQQRTLRENKNMNKK